MSVTQASLAAKNRILAACAQLFIEKSYNGTTVAEILKTAKVSASTFQNIFGAKDGVLIEFVKAMFGNQFSLARNESMEQFPPVYVYALETAIQLAITEQNENIRDIYVEAYTHADSAELIHQSTAKELKAIFSTYLPGCSESDFYEMDLGSAGMMRSYMARKCDMYFALEQKIRRFLTMSLSAYHVPQEEQEQILNFVLSKDIEGLSRQAVQGLFSALSMKFNLPMTQKNTKQEELS